MIINREELIKALEIVKPGLATKEITEQATSFAFIKDKVVTYNDEISISHPISGLEITGAVNANELYQFLGKIKKNDIEFEEQENQIVLRSGRSKAWLILEEEIKLPIEEIGEIGKWHALPENFTEGLRLALMACGTDTSRPVVMNVHIFDDIIEGTDSYRALQFKLPGKLHIKSTLIPSQSVKELIKMNPTKFAEGEGWIHFKTIEGTTISCRIAEDKFPDVSKHMTVKGITLKLPKLTNKLIERAMVFTKDQIDVRIENNIITVKGEAESGSGFEGEGIIEYEGDLIEFSIYPHLLKDILEKTKKMIIGQNKLKFKVNNWSYITTITNKEK